MNAAADAVTALLDAGRLRIYDGPQPPSPDRPPGAQCVLLVELRFQRPAFSPAVDGQALAHPLDAARAKAGGTATWFRAVMVDSTGAERAVFDGTVGFEGSRSDLELKTASIPAGSDVVIELFTYVQPDRAGGGAL